MRASVYVIAEPQVTGVRQFAANFDDLEHIIKLSVDVTDNSDGCWEVIDIFLLDENIFEFVADEGNGLLREKLTFEGLFNEVVDVEREAMFWIGHLVLNRLNSVYWYEAFIDLLDFQFEF